MRRARKEGFTHGMQRPGKTYDDCRTWPEISRRGSSSRCWIGERAPRPTWRRRRKCRRPSKSYLPAFSRGGALEGKSAKSKSSSVPILAAAPRTRTVRCRGAAPDPAMRDTLLRPPARFPFDPMFRNGPRRQGYAPENLFKNRKDFLPPRIKRAPLTAVGRSEDLQ